MGKELRQKPNRVLSSEEAGTDPSDGAATVYLCAVVHGLSESLCASQVPLGGFNGHVAQQKLNLFQLSACCVAETSARSAVVVRCQRLYPGRLAVLLHHVPHHLIRYPVPQMRP
jgi:hypothetical protein